MTEDRRDNQQLRLTSLVIVISLAAVSSVFFAAGIIHRHRQLLPNGLEDRINPNTASAASLARLPGFGRVKAEAIVLYRQNFSASGKEVKPFKDALELDKVEGIGQKTVDNISGFLSFN
jgi:competence ComEA-like helix-hairpin-helix protein